jgi:hypothetical protein
VNVTLFFNNAPIAATEIKGRFVGARSNRERVIEVVAEYLEILVSIDP